jgi:SWI/SNF-related matrix-associated actin-dependent regulator 1 of chromatin subfamily A
MFVTEVVLLSPPVSLGWKDPLALCWHSDASSAFHRSWLKDFPCFHVADPTRVWIPLGEVESLLTCVAEHCPSSEWIVHLPPLSYLIEIIQLPLIRMEELKVENPNPSAISDTWWNQLYPYQQRAVYVGVTQWKGRFMNGDEMGLGKTVQTLATVCALEASFPVLVVGPSSLASGWMRAVQKWCPHHPCMHWKSHQKPLAQVGFVFCSYGMLSSRKAFPQLKAHGWRSLILDESQYIKNRSVERSKKALELSHRVPYVMLLSGTPLDRHAELYMQMKALHPKLIPRFHGGKYHRSPDRADPHRKFYFADRYTEITKRYVHPRRPPVDVFSGSRHGNELHDILHASMLIRRLKKNHQRELPPKVRTYTHLGPLPKHVITKKLEGLAVLRNPEVARALEADRQFMECFLLTCQKKISLLVTYLKEKYVEYIESHPLEKFVFFTYHRDMMDALRKVFPEAGWIDGRVSHEQRAQVIRGLQTDPKCQVGLCSIQTTAAGVDLPQVQHIIFTELSFTPSHMLQAEDRAHRVGQTQQVVVEYILLGESTDDILMRIVDKKLRTSHEVLDRHQKDSLTQIHPMKKKRRVVTSVSLSQAEVDALQLI